MSASEYERMTVEDVSTVKPGDVVVFTTGVGVKTYPVVVSRQYGSNWQLFFAGRDNVVYDVIDRVRVFRKK